MVLHIFVAVDVVMVDKPYVPYTLTVNVLVQFISLVEIPLVASMENAVYKHTGRWRELSLRGKNKFIDVVGGL